MGIVVSMLLIAVGAIMRFAVTVKGHGFNVHTTGVILVIVGIVGAVLSIAYWASWGGFGPGSQRTSVIRTQATTVNGEVGVVHEREVL